MRDVPDGRTTLGEEEEEQEGEEEEAEETAPLMEREIGSGSQSVYAFYLLSYKVRAELKHDSRWPFKIGATTTSVAFRISQYRTGMSEEPIVALVIRTDDASTLEKLIHSVLAFRGQRTGQSGGAE